VEERRPHLRILAVVSDETRTAVARQLQPLDPVIEYINKAGEIAHLVSAGGIFDVAILPAMPCIDWWALWGEICLLTPSPAILVYARAATFELWTGVLDLGGYDLIVEPFSDHEIQQAVLLAAQSFRDRIKNDGAPH
jgi:hypothetical protein